MLSFVVKDFWFLFVEKETFQKHSGFGFVHITSYCKKTRMWIYSVRQWESFSCAINRSRLIVMIWVVFVCFLRCSGVLSLSCLSGETSSLVSIWQRFPLSLILCRLARSAVQALGSLICPGIEVSEDRLSLSFHPDSKESRSLAICVYSHLRGKAHASAL